MVIIFMSETGDAHLCLNYQIGTEKCPKATKISHTPAEMCL